MVGLVPMYTLYFLYDRAAKFLYDRAGTVLVLVCGYAWVIFFCIRQHLGIRRMYLLDMIFI